MKSCDRVVGDVYQELNTDPILKYLDRVQKGSILTAVRAAFLKNLREVSHTYTIDAQTAETLSREGKLSDLVDHRVKRTLSDSIAGTLLQDDLYRFEPRMIPSPYGHDREYKMTLMVFE